MPIPGVRTDVLLWLLLAAESASGLASAGAEKAARLLGGEVRRAKNRGPATALRVLALVCAVVLLMRVAVTGAADGAGELLSRVSVRAIPIIDTARDPNLQKCSATLERLQIALIVELALEIVLWFLICCCKSGMCYKETKVAGLMRAAYAVPVVALNAGILWFGSQGGSCLVKVREIQIAFSELVLFAVISILNVFAALTN